MTSSKLNTLKDIIRSYDSCLVAYSGGVDSLLLAVIAHQVLGSGSLAVIADTPSLPRAELKEAQEIAKHEGFALRILKTSEFENPEYLENNENRCYFCRHELFSLMKLVAQTEGFSVIVYGEILEDASDHRPGSVAASEFQVRSPLKEAGLSKAEIRELLRELGLPTADKPSMACLSSRIPHGESVSPEKIRMIESGEKLLYDLGLKQFRVRHHELVTGCLARIETGPEDISKILDGIIRTEILEKFRKIGYLQVTLDLAGYRKAGSMFIQEKTATDRK